MRVDKISKSPGFTIVELLIVIVVIGILAALVLNTFAGIQRRAKAASMIDGISKADKSLQAWKIGEGIVAWPRDSDFGGNPTLDALRSEDNFEDYMQNAPSVVGYESLTWTYDNDGDIKPLCGNSYNGVNLVIKFIEDQELVEQVDEQLDDGDLNCGTIRYTSTGILFYSLSFDQAE